ncbi:PucR family transcriptional regulator [Brevibacillus choshinensis]|uniref:PucR family transcriptional regulator ligand-binding domain-containing protein n=1 Tax=Brevibacillus choshinensis TaxID=54911 RepID=A0ABX7FXU9_BRECH|nr:PucR family transcriptional regulator [Brevibacillus choshinensis]QRG70640.1 PucR family transcriptional regulator ligand-binding domain-containing protein [Brevibacillus choshinensis]
MSNDWRLTVAESIKRPLFEHAEVVAGSRGLARPVRWVHVIETTDSCQYLNGGELILSTGLGFGGEREKRLAYLSELIRRKAVGLCMELGEYIPNIPMDMLEMANHHDFPLIVFHRPVRFVDITQDLHEHLINRQMQALRDLEAYSRSLQQLSLQYQGIPRVLQHFQNAVQTQVFLYTPDGATQYVPPLPQSVQTELTELMRSHLSQLESTNGTVNSFQLTDTKQIVYQPVMAMGHLLAYLGIVLYERQSDEYLLLTLDSTVSTLAQIMMRKMFVEEQALATENRLFDDLIANRPISEEWMRSHLGLSATERTPAYLTMLMSFQRVSNDRSDSLPPHDLTAVFRSVLSRLGWRPFIRCTGSRFTFLLVERQPKKDSRRLLEKAMKDLERITRQMMGADVQIWFGIGRVGRRLAEAGQHLAEAQQALAFQHEAQSPFFSDLGLFRLLFHIPPEPVLQNFIDDYLGPLLAHDREYGSSLVSTLRVYLDAHLSKQEAAEKLYIHRQTLYHRLEKITECLGEDFTLPHRRLCYEIALRALDWLEKEPSTPESNKKSGPRSLARPDSGTVE